MDPLQHKEELDDGGSLEEHLKMLRVEGLNLSLEETKKNISALADASRTDTSLRTRLATPETLAALLQILCTLLTEQTCNALLVTSTLRCLGNTCINNDDARSVIIQAPGSSWATACLAHSDGDIVKTSLKVIYNLCVDYEPAREWGYEQGLHEDLVALLSDCKPSGACIELDEGERGLGLELLFWITNRRPAASTASQPSNGTEDQSVSTTNRQLSRTTLHRLLRLPYLYAPDLDFEDFAMVVEICLTYLRDPIVQQQVHEYQLAQYVWRMLWDNEQSIQRLRNEDVKDGTQIEEIKMLAPLSSSLTWCLSDIAATRIEIARHNNESIDFEESFLQGMTEFIVFLGIPNEERAKLEQVWQQGSELTRQGGMVHIEPIPTRIASLPDASGGGITQVMPHKFNQSAQAAEQDFVPESQSILVAACQFLANALWRKELQSNSKIWARKDLYGSLWSAMTATQDAEVLHSAAGLLVQLSRCSLEFREAMARDKNANSALARLCNDSTPQIKQDGVKLLKALGRDSAVNQALFADLAKGVLESMANESEIVETVNPT